jgi:hypothetical protein
MRADQGASADAMRSSVRAVTGMEPGSSSSGGTSDGPFIIDICTQVLERLLLPA